MNSLRLLLSANRTFFLAYFLLLVLGGGLQLVYSQTELMQWVNRHANPATDVFFSYATYLGDGAFFAIVLLSLLLRSYRWTLKCLATFLLTTLIAQTLKHTVFAGRLRPARFFEGQPFTFRYVEGIELLNYYSFPSGHSTSAFALFCLLALIAKDKRWAFPFLALAALAAYSRVYLFQHFVEDVYAGSLIGITCTTLIFSFLQTYWQQKPRDWLDRGLLKRS
ncbi:MAG: phosphatase PAP2 family protein [Cytophagaceae bacterium]|nr:phosphatase PAP2 family protein [Cytophagaceae bacterium]